MQQLFGRDIFFNSRGHIGFDMYHVPWECYLTWAERRADSLQVQRGLLRARWRHVRTVRCRKVQGFDGNITMHQLSRLLHLVRELN